MDLQVQGRAVPLLNPGERNLEQRDGYVVDAETGAVVNEDKKIRPPEEFRIIVPKPYKGVQEAIKKARAQWSGADKNSCARYNPRMICDLWCAGSCYTWGSSNLREIAESCGRCGPEKECPPGSAQYPPGDW